MICFCLHNLRSWELNGRWIWELKLRRDDSSVEMLRDREFLRTGRMYFWEIVHTVVLNIFAGQWSGYNSRLCAGRPLGFVFNWRNYERELVERIFCGDGGCKTLTISQDRQNMYLFWKLFRLWSWKIAGPGLRLHAMCGNGIIGFKRRGVIWSWGASEVLKIQGLVKCWHFVKFGLCVKSLYTFDEIKNSTPEGILIIF